MNINLYINKQSVRAEAPEVFSGSVGVLTVTLFGELDSSLIPVLRFMHESGEGYYTAKIENGCATVPHEVIHAPGFSIAVAGYENDGESVKRFLPTEAAYIPVKENGYGSPDDAVSEEEDSESLIGQILSECQSVRGEVTDAKNELLEAKEELDLEAAERKKGDDTLAEAVKSENLARRTADGTLLLRIVKEEEARQTADSELEERITNAESRIKAAEDELIVSIKSEAAERESSDIRLQTELDKKVDKEEGKGLSDISGIDHMVCGAAVDGTIGGGGNFVNATEFYHEFVITHQSGAEDSISVYDTEQTCAVIDEKLSSFKPSQDVDLSEYVKKEEGKGLSSIANVRIENGADVSNPSNPDYFKEIYVDNQDETLDVIFVYDVNQIKNKLNNKRNEPNIITSIEDKTIDINDNQEVFLGVCNLLYLEETGSPFVGLHSYFSFESGETPTDVRPNLRIKFIGDDCDDSGNFTPQSNTRYEVDVKAIKQDEDEINTYYIARVGAC